MAGKRRGLTRAASLAAALSLLAACGSSPSAPDAQARAEGYLFLSNDTTLAGFGIADTGALSPLPGSPLALGSPAYRPTLTTDGGQRFLILGEDVNGSRARVFAIDRGSGSFGEVAGSPFPVGGGRVSRIGIAERAGVAASDLMYTAQPLRFDPGTGAISTFGSVSPLNGQFDDFVLHPSGALAFELRSNWIATYAIAAGGRLRLVSTFLGDQFSTWDMMIHLAIGPSGRWMAAQGGGRDLVHLFRVDERGVLEHTDRMSPGGTLSPPIAMDPQERFVFAATDDGAFAVVASLRIDAASGRLRPAATAHTQVRGGHLAVTPSGRFVYHVAAAAGSPPIVSGFSVDGGTGALTPVPGSPYVAAAGAHIVALR